MQISGFQTSGGVPREDFDAWDSILKSKIATSWTQRRKVGQTKLNKINFYSFSASWMQTNQNRSRTISRTFLDSSEPSKTNRNLQKADSKKQNNQNIQKTTILQQFWYTFQASRHMGSSQGRFRRIEFDFEVENSLLLDPEANKTDSKN